MTTAVETSASTRLTWGQLSEYHHLLKNGLAFPGAMLADIWPLPADSTATAVERALKALVSRHDTLRTEFRHPVVTRALDRRERQVIRVEQVVHGGDGLDFEVVYAADARVLSVCHDMLGSAKRAVYEPIAFDRRLVARLVRSSLGARALVVHIPHISVDHIGLVALKSEFAHLLEYGDAGVPDRVEQPREQLLVELGVHAQRRSERSKRYVEDFLAAAPAALISRLASPDGGATKASVVSAPAARAAIGVARRFSVSVPSVLLAAVGVLVRPRSDDGRVAVRSPFVGRPYALRRCVAPRNLPAFIQFAAPDDATVHDLVVAASNGASSGYGASGLDPAGLVDAEIAAEERRGLVLSGYCQFNYLGSADPARIVAGDGAGSNVPARRGAANEAEAFLSRDYQFVLNVAGGYEAGALVIGLTVATEFLGSSAAECVQFYERILGRMAESPASVVADLLAVV